MYDASIRQLDDWLARVLQRLDDARVLSDTVVVVASDHGENFGEGHRFGHTASLDNRLLHVPFVSAGPVALEFDRIASLADVPGALARALSVEAPFLDERAGPAGVAVAQLDAVGTKGDPRVDEAVKRWGLGDEAREIACASFTCATDGSLKLVRRLDVDELFDLTDDPLEEQPIVVDGRVEAAYGERLVPLRQALDAATAEEQDAVVGSSDEQAASEVAALEEQMRLLGYL
jgi:arylsulfatase A-like enzyme